MTKQQLLANTDSMELTKWFIYFEIRGEREEESRKDQEWRQRVSQGG